MASSTTPDAVPDSALELQGLRRLGDGGPDDRLRMRLVFGILLRCLRLLRPVKWHVARLFAGFAIASLAILPLALLFADTLWTRVLQGQPLTEIEAGFFQVPLEIGTTEEGFTPDVRRDVARKLIWMGAAISAGLGAGVWGGVEAIPTSSDAIDRAFTPAISEAERAARCGRWQRAVEASFGWAQA